MRGKHILFVDDFKDTRELFEELLSSQGFRVTVAADGQEALDRAFELQPDLVVMDLSLPVVSGYEAIRQIKADDRTKHTPVVVLSGHDFPPSLAGIVCEGWLVKPCFPNVFMAEIRRILNAKNHVPVARTAE